MGIGKWLARRGSIGATARWTAEGFFSALKAGIIDVNALEKNDKKSTEYELDRVADYLLGMRNVGLKYKEYVGFDYHSIPVADKRSYDTFLSELSTYRMFDGKSLIKLVLSILKLEANLHLNSNKNIEMYIDVIEEELTRMGVGERFIYGSGNPPTVEEISSTRNYLLKWSTEEPW